MEFEILGSLFVKYFIVPLINLTYVLMQFLNVTFIASNPVDYQTINLSVNELLMHMKQVKVCAKSALRGYAHSWVQKLHRWHELLHFLTQHQGTQHHDRK